MTQKRYLNFGTPGDAEAIKTTHAHMTAGGILTGGELSVGGTDYLNVTPYSIMFESGIVVTEDTIQAVTIPVGPGAQNFTISLVHEDVELVGGAAAFFQVDTGIKSSVANGIILGWLIYPGTIAIAASMIWNNRHRLQDIEEEHKQVIYPPYHDDRVTGLLVNAGGSTVVHGLGYLGTSITRYTATGADKTIIFSINFHLHPQHPPRVFEVVCKKAAATPATLNSFGAFDHSAAAISEVDTSTVDVTLPNLDVLRIFRLRIRDYSDLYNSYGLAVGLIANIEVYDGTSLDVYGITATNLEVPMV